MVSNFIRAALLSAAMLSIAAVSAFAQQADNALPPVPPEILAQLNQSAASQSNADFAQTVANVVAANPALAASIASAATQIRPAAATNIAATLATVVPTTQAPAIVNAIVNALPPADRPSAVTTIVSTYVNAAPPSAKDSLTVALAPVVVQLSQPAAGGQQNNQANRNQLPSTDVEHLQDTVKGTDNHPSQS